jgi:hypothetical protein
MVIARLLVVGLLSASLSVSSGHTGGPPRSKLVVQAMHLKWPDGSPVESGGLHYPTDIYVVDASGKHVRNLTHDDPTNYLIGRLPGRRILYENVPNDRMRARRSGIFSINVDGSGRRQLASGKGELLPKLSPDGGRILFARGRWLYVMRSNGTDKTRLAQTSLGYYNPSYWPYGAYDGAWSPEGKRVAFVRGFAKKHADGQLHPRSAIYVINADATGFRRLTKLRANVQTFEPTWSPDGRRIAFNQSSDAAIAGDRTYVMRADGTNVRRLKQLEGTDWFWLSNDRLAINEGGGGRSESVDANGIGKPRRLSGRFRVGNNLWITSGRSAGFWPVSPDGGWVPSTTPMRGLWITHLDGTHRRLVTRKICCFVWSWDVDWAGE